MKCIFGPLTTISSHLLARLYWSTTKPANNREYCRRLTRSSAISMSSTTIVSRSRSSSYLRWKWPSPPPHVTALFIIETSEQFLPNAIYNSYILSFLRARNNSVQQQSFFSRNRSHSEAVPLFAYQIWWWWRIFVDEWYGFSCSMISLF